ncbi:DUF4276 family protein [Sorangium sp. So ce362]|uniref:DUF4276 family protein n=1 Tax=Sorangium sp. So ce362 TaxID=3133303 RepID=UPI003F617BAF
MHLEILVEEPSAEVALNELVPKIVPGCTFTLHPHQGKTQLLDRLPAKLSGYAKWLAEDCRIVVLVDRDREDCIALKKRIVEAERKARLPKPLLCRIAIEELEAWFLGDIPALVRAYPGVPPGVGSRRRFRDPDAVVGGTWEALQQILQQAGYFPSGLAKIAAARAITPHMDVEANTSRSFQVFREGLRLLAAGQGTIAAAGGPSRSR